MQFHDNMTNYTLANGALPPTPTARVHLHGADDAEPDQTDPSRRPAMREPALSSEEDDILDRLQCLELAVATLATSGGESDFGGQGQLGTESGEPGDVIEQAASKQIA
jgi:hypothetical protein